MYLTHSELHAKWATMAKEAYVDGLVGQSLPCGCRIMLGKEAVVCDDPCHTAWNIVYRNERLNEIETRYPLSNRRSDPLGDVIGYEHGVQQQEEETPWRYYSDDVEHAMDQLRELYPGLDL